MAKILYFSTLVDKVGASSEETSLPDTVTDVRTLLAWLRQRGGNWEIALKEDAVRVTVNRQIADLETSVNDRQEIAIIPARAG
ncbi:MAG: MoaD/ThiS family protein [Gammaproteobacteria bacterium]|nr:MoaD/ThiS family protein [Gammaproteobacteria bacterium]MDH3369952.1 MoaD/ThiS family protein [Gammaproteobacteria bacterium]MDH3405404.1 MoaD/ThiS family protein [Gammaproteobacteria bacterium]MDH3562787.1 MoaD/ThiS family protein [Gammaproteobacteria bacterium]MDH5486822.1 MoaD/ThiS family protein [Gammaproteobacteria bacterium]